MNDDEMHNVINSFSMPYIGGDLYWTVMPTTQIAPVKTLFRLFKIWRIGMINQYDRTGWEIAGRSSEHSATSRIATNILDGNTSTDWHSNYTAPASQPPHWIVIDMKTPIKIFFFSYDFCATKNRNGQKSSYRCCWRRLWSLLLLASSSELYGNSRYRSSRRSPQVFDESVFVR